MDELDLVGETASVAGGVGVSEGNEPASAKAPALARSVDPAASLMLRMWRAELDIGAVEKAQTATVQMESGKNYTYKFSGYDVIVAAVKPALAKHGIKVIPTTKTHERIGNLTVLTVDIAFYSVDDPEDMLTVQMVNYGADKGDKGASKALTNCVREGIKKALGITSVEDDRADETTVYESDEGASRADLDRAKEGRRGAIENWARTMKSAIENATDTKTVDRIGRENSAQLMSEDLPEVTRVFFTELMERRKAELKLPIGDDL
jgi:predicted transcriptional regulator